MPKHEMEIEITKTGEVKVHIKGVKGRSCLTYARMMEQIVGKITSEQHTNEFYEPDEKARIDVEQKH